MDRGEAIDPDPRTGVAHGGEQGRADSVLRIAREETREDLKIPPEKLPAKFGFDDILAAHIPFQKGREKIHSRLKLTYDKQATIAVPEALRKLARIGPLKLFVTTTFDRLLERALNECRFDGASRTLAIAYSPKDNHNDLSTEMLESNRTIVFQLLGQITSDANYVVTEADLVEFIHSLDAKGPPRLLQAMGESNLLLLGNSFPAWVWRLFLRTAKNQVLWMRRQKNEVVVDRQISSDLGLRSFIESFSDETMICDEIEPAQFVDELFARWSEHAGSSEACAETPARSSGRLTRSAWSRGRSCQLLQHGSARGRDAL